MVKEYLQKRQPYKLVQKCVWDVAQNVTCESALCTRDYNMLKFIFLARTTRFFQPDWKYSVATLGKLVRGRIGN